MTAMEQLVEEAYEHYERGGVENPNRCQIIDYVAEAFQMEFGRELTDYDYNRMEQLINGRDA